MSAGTYKKILISCLSWCFSEAAHAGQPQPWQIGFQKAATPVMEKIVAFHGLLLTIIFAIAFLVVSLLLFIIYRYRASRHPSPSTRTHHTYLEIIWTLAPAFILATIAVPSFEMMFYMDKAKDAELTIKVVGYQWYWNYEYPDHHIKYDSLIVPDAQLKPGEPRLLTADQAMVVPVGATVRLLFTAADVIHSWAVPALGIKKDCVPGRVNETWLQIQREGVYHGQCSELCGMKHGFMPIVVRAVSRKDFQSWLQKAKQPSASAAAGVPPASLS